MRRANCLVPNGNRVSLYSYDFPVAFNRGFKPNEIAEVQRAIADRRAEIVKRRLEQLVSVGVWIKAMRVNPDILHGCERPKTERRLATCRHPI